MTNGSSRSLPEASAGGEGLLLFPKSWQHQWLEVTVVLVMSFQKGNVALSRSHKPQNMSGFRNDKFNKCSDQED
jgi:hypothetical protein